MNVLVLNCGSSSVKYQLIDTSLERIESNTDRTLARGEIEIGRCIEPFSAANCHAPVLRAVEAGNRFENR